MRKLMLLIMVILTFSLFAETSNLIISEYVEGSGYNKVIEIFNGTGAEVDLSNYFLKKQTNGSGGFDTELALSGTLANEDVYVVCNDQATIADEAYVDLATGSQVVSFNGNDAIALYQGEDPVDIVGVVDSSDDWGKDMTLIRMSHISDPNTIYDSAEWIQEDPDYFDNLGTHEYSGGSQDPQIIISSPSEDDTWLVGETYDITWTNVNFEDNVTITLNVPVRMTIAEDVSNTGSYTWTVPEEVGSVEDAMITVEAANDGDPYAESGIFSILDGYPEVTIYDIQYVEDPEASDVSPYVDQILTTTGVVTAKSGSQIYIQDGAGAWNGLNIYSSEMEVDMGDEISVTGTVVEYYGKTEITDVLAYEILGDGVMPDTVSITTNSLTFNESYESVLVKVENVMVTAEMDDNGNWQVDDNTGACVVEEGDYSYVPVLNDEFASISGIVNYSYSEFRLLPRNDADFILPNSTDDNINSLNTFKYYPNPARLSVERNNTLTIELELKADSDVRIDIYNIKGQLVKNIVNRNMTAGHRILNWNGLDTENKTASSGVYFLRFKDGRFTKKSKFILIK